VSRASVKDRESEFADLVSRTAEDFSYAELSNTEGKLKLARKILDELNSNLTKGKIRKVMYSSFILKN
jgi:flagellar basal body-associated protein FliL